MMEIFINEHARIRSGNLEKIAAVVEQSIAGGGYPGAVVLAGQGREIIYRGVFGSRSVMPEMAPMRFETVFDVASLTKVVVTTTAIMQLWEAGRLDIEAPVAQYWPGFAGKGKTRITIRQLLTHTSGLPAIPPAWTPLAEESQCYSVGLAQLENIELVQEPGKVFVYSDTNFIILGYLAELISGERLDQYAQARIFKPLQMHSAIFLPPLEMRNQIAPTQSPENQEMRWGQVNDPTTERMGGITGVAGLFANAHDLGVFLQCLLNDGHISGSQYLLAPKTVRLMTTRQTPAEIPQWRGLGWDIDSPYSCRGTVFPLGAFNHTGWTGVSMLADPSTQTWIVILTSRSHPFLPAQNQLIADRRAIADIIASSLLIEN
jgi:serine-type D-Ala-D-Ala carboxypeptidase